MAENPSDQKSAVRCPICGSTAESGCLYGCRFDLRWRAGEPSFWGSLFSGARVRGIRCATCRRIVLKLTGNEDGPGIELVMQASDLERNEDWDQALALYRRVLAEPRYRAHHEYARNGIKAEPGSGVSCRASGP